MKWQFTKMHGAGNDYIYLDCRQTGLPSDAGALAVRLSRRRVSVGADGLICIAPPLLADADATMVMYNADGSEGVMCGNGVRCVAEYLYTHGTRKELIELDTLHAGRKTLGDDGPGMRFDHGRAPELGRQPILLREAKARTKTGGGEPPEGVLKARIRVGHGRGPQPPKGQRFVTERMRRLPTGSAASALARFTASMLSAEAVKRSIRPFSPTKGSPFSSRP